MHAIRVRALIGEWEGCDHLLLGAIAYDQYEAIRDEDAVDGTSRWEEITCDWRRTGPAGITDTREVDIRVLVPLDLFLSPQLSAEVDQPAEQGRSEAQ